MDGLNPELSAVELTSRYVKDGKLYVDVNETEFPPSDYEMGTTSNSRAFEIESWTYIQHKNYFLHVLQKAPLRTSRKKIPTSLSQRLTFFRCYVCAPAKYHIATFPYFSFGRVLYMHVLGMLFSSWPSCYIHQFLSAYAPEEYIYLAKMMPIASAFNLYTLCSLFLELMVYTRNIVHYLDFVTKSFLFRNPWKVCEDKVSVFYLNISVTCLELDAFRNKMDSGNISYLDSVNKMYFYDDYTHEAFETAATQYLRKQFMLLETLDIKSYAIVYILVIWIFMGSSYKFIFCKSFWSIYNRLHWVINVFYLLILFCIFVADIETTTVIKINENYKLTLLSNEDEYGPYVFALYLSDIVVSPVLIHILVARSEEQVNPGPDSAIVEVSNALYCLMNALLTFKLEWFCLNRFGTTINSEINDTWFRLWLVFFSTFQAGELICMVLFTLLLLMHIFTLLVMFHCFTEVFICEWPKIRSWMINVFFVASTMVLCIFLVYEEIYFHYMFAKYLAVTSITCTVCCLYPLWRFIDDHTFLYGFPPNAAVVILLKVTGVIYMVIFVLNYEWHIFYWYHHAPIIIFGTIYIFYFLFKHHLIQDPRRRPIVATGLKPRPVYRGGMLGCLKSTIIGCQELFRPTPQWGPREQIPRELRKRYESNDYIPSQSSRYLSRYLMERRERVYKLDVNYDQRPAVKCRNPSVVTKFDDEATILNSYLTVGRHRASDPEPSKHHLIGF